MTSISAHEARTKFAEFIECAFYHYQNQKFQGKRNDEAMTWIVVDDQVGFGGQRRQAGGDEAEVARMTSRITSISPHLRVGACALHLASTINCLLHIMIVAHVVT